MENDGADRELERKCDLLGICTYFRDRMADLPAMAGLMRRKFCEGHPARCARHMVFVSLGIEKVPRDLDPYNVERAEAIIELAEA